MARVIEQKIINRIQSWNEGEYKLSVRDRIVIAGDKAIYYLWHSPIVTVYKEADGKNTIKFSFCNYSSQTTKQRISELLFQFMGCYIFRKNWIHYLKWGNDYYKINESQSYTAKDGILFDTIGNKVEPLRGFKY